MNKWIKCEENLPSDSRRVLGTDGIKQEIVIYINTENNWCSPLYGFLYFIDKVEYWIDLPDLPKVD